MSDRSETSQSSTSDQPEYRAPEVQVLGSLQELTDGVTGATLDDDSVGSL